MCRHLAYLGPPTPVGELLTRGPHSLRTQSWAPREMRGGGTINADGFGVAWWHAPDAAEPDHGPGVIWHGGASPDVRAEARTASTTGDLMVSRYRNAAPIWTDPAVDEVLPQIRSTAVLAAIRSATVGMPIERSACAPFTHGRWAFSHNGAIPDWRRVLTEVAAEFGSPPLLEAESLIDSAALWVILRGLLEGSTGDAGAAQHGEAGSSAAAPEADPSSAWGSGGSTRASAAGEATSRPTGSHGFGTTASFGSTVSVTSTSGAPPEVRAWAWTSTSEGGGENFGSPETPGPAPGTAGSTTRAYDPAQSGSREEAASSSAREASGASSVSADAGARHGREFPGAAGDPAGGWMEPGEALRRVTAAVLARSPKARLNLLLGDGVGVWGSTWHHSLSVLDGDGFVVVASEPFDDDPRWRPIADRQLVRVTGGRVAVEPLDIEIGRAGS